MSEEHVNKQSVYVLVDPRDGRVFYVGRTAYTSARLHQHLTRPGAAWKYIQELKASGFLPEMKIVAPDLAQRDAVNREYAWIRKLALQGEPLCNRTGPVIGHRKQSSQD